MSHQTDKADLRTLAIQVFYQAYTDFVHLQHPKTRTKPYVNEAWLSAIDMFFDPDYRLDFFQSEETEDGMNIDEFLQLVSDRENLNLEKLYSRLSIESSHFWENTMLDMYEIPRVFTICGMPYTVSHKEIASYSVDYVLYEISLNLTNPSDITFVAFFQAIVEIICYHTELRISKEQRLILGKTFFETLRLNNSFLK